MAETRIQDIYLHLKNSGFEVYFPAQKMGECLTNYVVVRDAGSSQMLGYSTVITYYELLCYVPKGKFSQLHSYKESVKEAMKELVPMIQPTYTETQSFYDDTIKGHMVSIQYRNYQKIDLY